MVASDRVFFLSYARRDREDDPFRTIDTFFEDLCRAIAHRTGLATNEVGFLDTTDVQTGDPWPGTIEEALRTCRAFVPILSPAYLTRPYCGKEWSAFRSRLTSAKSPLIQPVLLVSRRYLPPIEAVTDIADSDDRLPEIYRSNGLDVVVRLGESHAYQELITAYAERLLEVTNAHPLAPAPSIAPLNEIPSAFHETSVGLDLPSVSDEHGPKYAVFMFVTAAKKELTELRTNLEAYATEDPAAWRPWHPTRSEHLSQLVARVALDEQFLPSWAAVNGDVVDTVKKAMLRGNIVIILADPWTLRLISYQQRMSLVDEINLMNCVIAVLWNETDTETALELDTLRNAVRQAFANRTSFGDAPNFLDRISSADELCERLAIALREAAARVAEYRRIKDNTRATIVRVPKPELTISAAPA